MPTLRARPPRRRRFASAVPIAAGLALLGSGPRPAAASPETVHLVPDEFATITDAIAVAVPGDSIRVSESGSPYVEALTLVDGVIYQGAWNADFTDQNALLYETVVELPGGLTESVVDCGDAGPSTVFAAFTVQGGNSSALGGGISAGPNTGVLIRNCLIRNNRAATAGGGITIGAGSSAQVFNCVLEDNVAGRRGGGISVAATAVSASIDQCTVVRCSTSAGTGTDGGGGMYITAPIRFTRNTITDCFSANRGGGLLVRNADVVCESATVSGSSASADGGGMYVEGGAGTYWGCAIDSCSAGESGGGIYFEGGANTLSTSFVRSNQALGASGLGGGIYFDGSHAAELRLSEVHGNSADQGGGIAIRGIPLARFTAVTLVHNTITANVSPLSGVPDTDRGAGVHVFGEFLGPFVDNVISHQLGTGISCLGVLAQPNLRHNCVWNDPAVVGFGTEYGGECDDRTGFNGNIRNDPLLCDVEGVPPDLALTGTSPCLGAAEDGTDIGAHGRSAACGTVSIEPTSWGSIKARYR